MTHAFMYPRVTQIAQRAHSVPASSLGTHLRPAASAGAMTRAAGMPAPARRA
jgi:hypothetical protein